ncbi:hypothetical protein HaLaN_01559 [Haematococcus lacustris]|uniref:Uncharacterized protein n=1 Tax=Haematococcus lacustris TaxID=44745 RepID=A0A699YBW8_HAELA|nr:hypothetical protein HaLaN_01559 [Haematococcus lacustris]
MLGPAHQGQRGGLQHPGQQSELIRQPGQQSEPRPPPTPPYAITPTSKWPSYGTHCCLTLAARSSPVPSTDSIRACTPRMGKGMGAVNPLAHLHAEWLGVDHGGARAARHWQRGVRVAQDADSAGLPRQWHHAAGPGDQDVADQDEAAAQGPVAGQAQLAGLVPAVRRHRPGDVRCHVAEVSKPRWVNAKFRLYCGKQRVVARFWFKLTKQAKQQWTDRILALGTASFSGNGTIGRRGVLVSQMLKEALKAVPSRASGDGG